MKYLFCFLFFLRVCFGLSFGFSCFAQEAPSQQDWLCYMQKIGHSFSEIWPFLESDEIFLKPENQKKILAVTDSMTSIAAQMLILKPTALHQNPTIYLFAPLFERDMQHIRAALYSVNKTYARQSLKEVRQKCIEWYLQLPLGLLEKNVEQLKKGISLDQLDAFILFRKMDAAYEGALLWLNAEKNAKTLDILNFEKIVKLLVRLSLRLQKKDAVCIDFLGEAISKVGMPAFLKVRFLAWKKSLEYLKTDTQWGQALKQEARMPLAKKFMDLASQTQRYPMDPNGDVYYLAASMLLYDYLSEPSLKDLESAEALNLLGNCARSLNNLQNRELPALFFSVCIHKNPHSPIAHKCYQQYEEIMYMGFTGTAGKDIPSDVQGQLKVLEKLSSEHLEMKLH